jgi:hypothetical protein
LGGRDRWISEFEASLVYKLSSRTAKTIQRNLVSKKPKKKKKKKKRKRNTLYSTTGWKWKKCLRNEITSNYTEIILNASFHSTGNTYPSIKVFKPNHE